MAEKNSLKVIAWRILCLCVFAFGLWALIYSYVQPTFTATIRSVGPATSRSHHRRSGGSYTTYHRTLAVTYLENGEEVRAEVEVSYQNRWAPPQVGGQLQVSRNILGKVIAFPDRSLRTAGLLMTVGGAVFLAGIGLSIWAGSRDEQEKIRSSGRTDADEPEEKETLPAGFSRTNRGGIVWRGSLGDDYVRERGNLLIRVMWIIALCILGIGGILSLGGGGGEFLLFIALTCFLLLLIGYFCRWYMIRSSSSRWEIFEINEAGVRIGSGRSSSFFFWENIREVRDAGEYLEIQGKISTGRIYASEEMMPFVRECVRKHLPDGIR